MIRNLSQSSDADDQARAQVMKKAVGGKLNNDYSTQANKTGARWALTMMVLSLSTFLMRTSQPEEDAPAMQKPAVQITAFHHVPPRLKGVFAAPILAGLPTWPGVVSRPT